MNLSYNWLVSINDSDDCTFFIKAVFFSAFSTIMKWKINTAGTNRYSFDLFNRLVKVGNRALCMSSFKVDTAC